MKIARLAILTIFWTCLALPAKAQTISWIDWVPDSVIDGMATGTITNRNTASPTTLSVSLLSAPLTNNGGNTFGMVWSGSTGTNGTPGITSGVTTAAVVLAGTLAAPATNTVQVTSGGMPFALVNPILLFNYINPTATLMTFPDVPNVPGSLVLLDHAFSAAPVINGNSVTYTGAGDNSNSSFAIQMKGTYSTIKFVANQTNGASPSDSYGFTLIQPNYAVLKISRTWQVIDKTGLGAKAYPGNDMQFNVELTNEGGASADADTAFVVQTLPTNWAFFTGDADGAGAGTGPVQLTVLNGANVTLTQSATTGVAYSSSATAPTSFAQCSYTPTGTYDANVRHICISLKGSFAAATPFPIARLLYLARIN